MGLMTPIHPYLCFWHLWTSLSLFNFCFLRILGIPAALPTSQDELYLKLREIMSVWSVAILNLAWWADKMIVPTWKESGLQSPRESGFNPNSVIY